MENSNNKTQQGKRKGCLSVLSKVFVGGIAVVVILAVVFIMPLPFNRTLWRVSDGVRWRMEASVSRQISGMSRDEVIQMLGTPQHSSSRESTIAYSAGLGWRHFVITFDSNYIVRDTSFSNPAHFGLGG